MHLTSSFPSSPGDPSGHFVAAEARRDARRAKLRSARTGALPCEAQVAVLAPAGRTSTYAIDDAERVHGVTVHRVPDSGALGWPGAWARMQQRPLRIAGYARFLHGARVALARLAPAELVVHWPVPHALAIAGTREVTFVSHGADVRLLCAMPAPLRAQVVRRLVTRATTWRFVSQGLADQLFAALSDAEAALVATKLRIEPCPIEMPEIDRMKAQRTLEALRGTDATVRPLYVSLGRLIPLKRVEHALRYAQRHDADLLVIGDGPERARLETYARQVGARASFCGALPRGDALGLLSRADALLMTSASEGLPTVVREAEALGTPVRWVSVG